MQTLFDRYRRRCKFSYNKINDSNGGERLLREFSNLAQNDLNVIVLNFIDMLSHARTEAVQSASSHAPMPPIARLQNRGSATAPHSNFSAG